MRRSPNPPAFRDAWTSPSLLRGLRGFLDEPWKEWRDRQRKTSSLSPPPPPDERLARPTGVWLASLGTYLSKAQGGERARERGKGKKPAGLSGGGGGGSPVSCARHTLISQPSPGPASRLTERSLAAASSPHSVSLGDAPGHRLDSASPASPRIKAPTLESPRSSASVAAASCAAAFSALGLLLLLRLLFEQGPGPSLRHLPPASSVTALHTFGLPPSSP